MAVGVVTRRACELIAHEAFRLAATRRKRVTIVHKANVLPMTMGLFRDVCFEIGHAYPGVEVLEEHVDATAAHLVRAPGDFDVIVTENLFGDILSDLAGELSGSLGMAASLNCSATRAMAQAVHGAAPGSPGTIAPTRSRCNCRRRCCCIGSAPVTATRSTGTRVTVSGMPPRRRSRRGSPPPTSAGWRR